MNETPSDSPQTETTPAHNLSSNVVAQDSVVAQDHAPTHERPAGRSPMKWALVISLIAHGVLLVALLFWYLPRSGAKGSPGTTAKSTAGQTSGQTDQRPTPPPELTQPQAGDDIPAEQIKKSIQSQIEAVKKLPVAAKLSELDKNLQRLKSIANEKSVEQVTQKIGSTLGLDTQAYQPKNDVPAGDFDLDTAQLSDVTRRAGDDGQWVYEATLIDAQGRTNVVPMAASEGATMHDVFAKMKKYPMAAGIYRSVVMPMLQKMIEAEKAAKSAAKAARQIKAAEESNQD